MYWVISYWTTEYAGLLPGWKTPYFSNSGKNIMANAGSWDKGSASMTKESVQAES